MVTGLVCVSLCVCRCVCARAIPRECRGRPDPSVSPARLLDWSCGIDFLGEDFSHHIGAAVQLLTPACKYLHKEDRRKKILDIFTQVRDAQEGERVTGDISPRPC